MCKKILVALDNNKVAADLRNDNPRTSLFKDLLYGNTITRVRHRARVPVLLVNVTK